MSIQITTAFVHEWERGITHLAEQKMSRFRGKTRMTRIGAGDEKFVDQIGSVTAQIRTTRHGDTPLTDTPHSRRQVPLNPYEHADLVDEPDKLRTLNDPTNEYMVAFGRAFSRAIDDEVIAAALGSANTGVTGGTAVAHPGGDFQIAAGGDGLTMVKLILANRVLRENENDPDEGFYIAVSQAQIDDMLNDTTFTSADYNNIRTLMTGEITQFMGFTWVASERLGLSGTERRCIAWAKNSLLLAIGKEPSGKISERPDKSYSTQIYMSMDIGATRLDETGVIEILCEEA
jgi:hypothetical protein